MLARVRSHRNVRLGFNLLHFQGHLMAANATVKFSRDPEPVLFNSAQMVAPSLASSFGAPLTLTESHIILYRFIWPLRPVAFYFQWLRKTRSNYSFLAMKSNHLKQARLAPRGVALFTARRNGLKCAEEFSSYTMTPNIGHVIALVVIAAPDEP